VRIGPGAILLVGLAACSARDPDPSPRFDGRYVGERVSDQAEACGVARTRGTTSAVIARGHLTMPLFSPRTRLDGTVGADGTLRASGIWANPTGGFPGETVLNGQVVDDVLEGTASDFRCHTDIHLRKVVPPRKPPNRKPSISSRTDSGRTGSGRTDGGKAGGGRTDGGKTGGGGTGGGGTGRVARQ
jgi:hypothetical protein